MNPIPINKYALTVAEAASVLGISSGKIYQMLKSNAIPAHKSGRIWRIPVAAITALIHHY